MAIEILDRSRLARNPLSQKVERTFPFSSLRVSGGGPGLCMTTVYLSDVKSIRISNGLNCHTREPEHISGLWFDFWGSDQSVIVGQWINQVGLFEFAAEEQIANLVICRSPRLYVSSVTGPKLLDSRVTGLQLVTSDGTKKELQLSNADNISEEHYSTNPAEALVGFHRSILEYWHGLTHDSLELSGSLTTCTMLFASQPTPRTTLRAFLLQPSSREEESRLFIDNISGHLVMQRLSLRVQNVRYMNGCSNRSIPG